MVKDIEALAAKIMADPDEPITISGYPIKRLGHSPKWMWFWDVGPHRVVLSHTPSWILDGDETKPLELIIWRHNVSGDYLYYAVRDELDAYQHLLRFLEGEADG
jgi:hypothetical protein